jgi:lysophospholipid hydrolase
MKIETPSGAVGVSSTLSAALRRSNFFHTLPYQALEALEAEFTPVTLMSGEVLFRQGDRGDSLYLLVSGRLVVTHRSETQTDRVVAELGHGEIVGEMGLLSGETRSATVTASRDSHLARLSAAGLERITAKFGLPFYSAVVRQLATRLRNDLSGIRERKPSRVCIAIAALDDAAPLAAFTDRLVAEISQTEKVQRLNSEITDTLHGMGAAESVRGDTRHDRLTHWLAAQETQYSKVIYECDPRYSEWTRRCLRQADAILLLARASDGPGRAASRFMEMSQLAAGGRTPAFLVLLHENGSIRPSGTRTWTSRISTTGHFHVRLDSPRDFGRLARFLNDNSVGLALGGGFARGLGHIGAIRAMRELEIPIDMVGGTSMGAIVGGQCAIEKDWREMLEVTVRHSSASLTIGDYTLPIVSFLSGRKISRAITSVAGDLDIEDLWLPFFCVSASLTTAKMKVHTSGNAARSVIASSRAPGLFPPITWNGELLVDGGLVNMVPSDVMREFAGQGTVVSIDVSAPVRHEESDFGLWFSGWQALRRRLGLFSPSEKTPGLVDLLMRTLEFGRSPAARLSHLADAYLTLPLDNFRYRDFHRGQEIVEISYRFALEYFSKWLDVHGRPWLRAKYESNAV